MLLCQGCNTGCHVGCHDGGSVKTTGFLGRRRSADSARACERRIMSLHMSQKVLDIFIVTAALLFLARRRALQQLAYPSPQPNARAAY